MLILIRFSSLDFSIVEMLIKISPLKVLDQISHIESALKMGPSK